MKFDKDAFDIPKEELIKRVKSKVRKGSNAMVRKTITHQDKTKYNRSRERNSMQKVKFNIHEQQILTNSRLNNHQKSVLAILIGKQDGKSTVGDVTAHVDQANKQNITMAIENLQKLGLLNIDQNKTLKVSDKGHQQMVEENLIDDSGMLTPDGQKFETMFSNKEEDSDTQDIGGAPIGGVPAPGTPGINDQPSAEGGLPPLGSDTPMSPFGESILLIRQIVEDIKFNTILNKFK